MDRPGSRFGYRCFGLSFFTYIKSQKIERKACDAFHKIAGQAENVLDEAKEKAADAGEAVADKVADKASDFAGKADDFKSKMHAVASEARK